MSIESTASQRKVYEQQTAPRRKRRSFNRDNQMDKTTLLEEVSRIKARVGSKPLSRLEGILAEYPNFEGTDEEFIALYADEPVILDN